MSRTSWTEGTSPFWTSSEWAKAQHSVSFHLAGLNFPSYSFERSDFQGLPVRIRLGNDMTRMTMGGLGSPLYMAITVVVESH